MTQLFTVSELTKNKSDVCRDILAALPQWFGIPESAGHVAAVGDLPMLAAKTADDEVVGFLALKFHTTSAAEAFVLGAHPAWHRRGVGTKLFHAAFEKARSRGARYLTVKTLAASHPDPHYRATRLFYEALGFEPIEVFPTLWDERNPCLLMLKRLD